MRYILRGVVYLVLAAAAALVIYAYVGDLAPQQQDMSLPVAIGAGS